MPGEQRSLKEVFLDALAIAPAVGAAWLENACGCNSVLGRQVVLMLAAHDEPQSLIDRMAPAGGPHEAATGPGAAGPDPRGEPLATETARTMIGPYKLLEQIGEGGMGTVWMAEQTAPIHRRVAIKVVKEGMDSKQVLARFEAERLALALMDHPNIARVFDATKTPAGRPYFVMELVKGLPITRYCDEKRLGVRERLGLFADVCRAVQHAHQKGIIHRDIKPSNVLVAPFDGRPVVKVIDFGVAKATGQRLTDKTLFTGFGAVVGTLEYMSPEQAELNNQDIDTRSDVYSLGVLLYELLTGTTPLSRKRLKETAMLEVLRLIREEEAPRPSTRLSTTGELPTVAANRGLEPKKLSGLVRGELDWIVMKALEKDRNRRYETANGFALDVQRFLADETVQACPPSAWYRLRKVVRRHKGLVLAVAVFLVLLVAGIVGTSVGLVRALAAERKTQAALASARAALDTLTDDVVETMFARQPELGQREKAFLHKILESYEEVTAQLGETSQARVLRARGTFQVARLHALLGDPIPAVEGYRLAVLMLGQLVDDFPNVPEYRQQLALSQHSLGRVLADLGMEAEAETAFRHALALRQKLVGDFPQEPSYRRDLSASYNDLALLLQLQKKFGPAESAYREALTLKELQVRELGAVRADRLALAQGRANLANLFRAQGRFVEAEQLYRQALTDQKNQRDDFAAQPASRRELADSYHGLGIVRAELHREEAAETAFQQALALRKKLMEDFPKIVRYRHELANLYNDLGSLLNRQAKREAATAWQEALTLWKQLADESPRVPDFQSEVAATLGKLATLHIQGQEFAAALTLLAQARPHNDAALAANPQRPQYRLCHRNNLHAVAQCYVGLADHSRLAATADEVARFGYDPANDTYVAACMTCNCVELAARNTGLDEIRRNELAASYTERALALLRDAVARGFKDTEQLRENPDLKPLRRREEFRKLIAELETRDRR